MGRRWRCMSSTSWKSLKSASSVRPGLVGPCSGQNDAVGHGQPQFIAELGSGDDESAVEIDDQSALHDCRSLDGLGLAVFAQHPLVDHLEDAGGRVHNAAGG
jgi:hypothetical protein